MHKKRPEGRERPKPRNSWGPPENKWHHKMANYTLLGCTDAASEKMFQLCGLLWGNCRVGFPRGGPTNTQTQTLTDTHTRTRTRTRTHTTQDRASSISPPNAPWLGRGFGWSWWFEPYDLQKRPTDHAGEVVKEHDECEGTTGVTIYHPSRRRFAPMWGSQLGGRKVTHNLVVFFGSGRRSRSPGLLV